jgi:hypothetical protein
MVSTVRSISNHYETLRISPAATNEEIAAAFASQIKNARVRPDITVAQLAQISVAYETLRDPVRRRAYDASLGFRVEPKQQPAPPPPPAEVKVGSFIAASLREPVQPRAAETRPKPDPVPQWPIPKAETPPRPRVELALEPREETRSVSIDRRQATIGAGVAGLAILALAVTLPGGHATAPGPTTVASTAPSQAVTVGLPPATPAQGQAVPQQAPVTTLASALPVPQPTVENATSAVETAPATASADQPHTAESEQPTASASTEAAPEQPAATEAAAVPAADIPTDSAPVATAAAAKLPLAADTIARTIARIGYACGSVVSSNVVSEGVFKITCSSGDSYQASPRNGRYHFRRWGSH